MKTFNKYDVFSIYTYIFLNLNASKIRLVTYQLINIKAITVPTACTQKRCSIFLTSFLVKHLRTTCF